MTKTTATLTARSPEDVLAAVPLVLGFMPEESVVMLAQAKRKTDPPATPDDDDVSAEVLDAAR